MGEILSRGESTALAPTLGRAKVVSHDNKESSEQANNESPKHAKKGPFEHANKPHFENAAAFLGALTYGVADVLGGCPDESKL